MVEKPNIVLVTVDSLRADHCGFMGYEKDTTPMLDEMAAEGVVFKNAVAPAPFTEESIPPLFTGSYPMRSDERDGSIGELIRRHIEKHRSVAEELSDAGYATSAFSPNPHASRLFGLDRGFDTFHDFIGDETFRELLNVMASRLTDGDLVEALRLGANMLGLNIPGFGNQSIPMRAYYDQMLEWASSASSPFFLWAFPLEVHTPYRPKHRFRDIWFPEMLYLNLVGSALVKRDPEGEEVDKLVSLYDGAIRSVDASINRLREDLSDHDPVIIITSDHGEAFGDHGNFGHNAELHSENVHVPLVIAGIDDSDSISEPVSLRELPRIIGRIADGGQVDWRQFTESSVSTRVQGKKVGVWTRNTNYIVSGESSTFYNHGSDSDDDLSNESPPLTPVLETVGRVVTDRRERTEIEKATETISGGNQAL